ncbi:MAG: hypothetical protein JXQ96_16610 [Cyclobacteriaceae bacterium]
MEYEYFSQIRDKYCESSIDITSGKMMSSEAIQYKGKVFAFLSRKNRMVFKLGKEFDPVESEVEIYPFSPFKNKKPMGGWFEADYDQKDHWGILSEKALNQLKLEL